MPQSYLFETHRVGAWRLLDLLKETRFPVSLLVNSAIYSHCPELPAAYCDQLAECGKKCEIVGHGCSNAEKQVTLTTKCGMQPDWCTRLSCYVICALQLLLLVAE